MILLSLIPLSSELRITTSVEPLIWLLIFPVVRLFTIRILGLALLSKLEDKSLDSNDLLNYTKQKESNESQLSQLDTKLNILNRNNQDELDEIKKLTESFNEVKSDLIDISKLVKNEWQMIDEKLSVFESEKKELISTFPQKVQELYDDLKSRGVDVIAAYRLENNQCGCCGVDLTSSELDSIFDTEFQQCPYCGGILV